MENKKIIMGIDISLRACGVGIIDGDKKVLSTQCIGWEIPKGKSASISYKMTRWFKIWNAISKMIEEHNVEVVFIEDYSFGAKFGREKLAEVHAVIISQMYLKHKIMAEKIAIGKWRKYCLKVSKKLTKQDIVKEYKPKYPELTTDEYEAIGIAIGGHNSLYDIEVKADLIK